MRDPWITYSALLALLILSWLPLAAMLLALRGR